MRGKTGAQAIHLYVRLSLSVIWPERYLTFHSNLSRTDVYQLGLENLGTIAHEDIAAKTSARNVVREAFSRSTAR